MTIQTPAALSAVDDVSFKQLMSRLANSVTVVTTYSEDLGPRGLTCSAFMSVSAAPPTIAIGVNARSSFLQAVDHSGTFAVNVLHKTEADTALVFASPSEDRFSKVGWRHSHATHSPLFEERCIAQFDCRLLESVASGDHVVVFGLVLAADQSCQDGAPLVHCRRAFGTWSPA